MSASDTIQLAFTQTWQIIVLILVVYFVSKTVARKHVHLAHVLWLVVLAKCLVPPIVSSPAGLFCWIDFSVAQVRPIDDASFLQREPIERNLLVPHPPEIETSDFGLKSPTEEAVSENRVAIRDTTPRATSTPLAPDQRQSNLLRVGLFIWLGGAAIVFTLLFARTALCFYRIRRAGMVDSKWLDDLVIRLRRELEIKRPVSILITESRIGPLVYGLFRPTILIPRLVFERSSAVDLIPILTHELIHVRRGDLWINLIQIFANALWWFNPLVWLANRNVSRAAESCCDEQTVASLGCSTKEYARSLLKILELKRSLSSVPAFPGIRPVEITSKRLERIMKLRQGCHKRTPAWCWAAMIGLMLISLPGAAWVLAGEPKSESTASQFISPRKLSAETTQPPTPLEIMKFEPGTPQIAIETRFVTLPQKDGDSIDIAWSFLQVPPKRNADKKAKRNIQAKDGKTARQPQGRSQTVIETNEPVKFAILKPGQTDRLLESLHGMRKANVLQAPKVTLFDRQTASISDSSQRPFVVGFHDNDHQLQIVSEGTVIDCQPEALKDGSVWLDLTVTYSEIRDVRESTITKPESAEKITVQIPEVQRTAIGVELEVPAKQTLVLAGSTKQNAKKQLEQLLVIIRPQVLPLDQLSAKTTQNNAQLDPNTSEDDPLGPPGKPWDLSLSECIRIAIQNSKVTAAANLHVDSGSGTSYLTVVEPGVPVFEFEGSARNLVSEVTKSYWELYFYYHNLDAGKTGRDNALLNWRDASRRLAESYGTERQETDATAVPQSQEQYFFFRGRVEEGKRDLLKAERQLRFLIGMAADDGRIIRPSDKPSDMKLEFDWEEIKNETMQNSAEIKRQKERIVEQRQKLHQHWKALKPQVEAQDLFEHFGFEAEANDDFVSDKFLGITHAFEMAIPLGLRAELAKIRQQQLALARSESILQDLKVEQTHALSDAVQNLDASYKLMETAAMQVLSASQHVEALKVQFKNGGASLEFLLDAQRRLADARIAYFQSLLQYNFSIVEVHYRKGTLLSEYKYRVVAATEG